MDSMMRAKNSCLRLGLGDRTISANIVLVENALIIFGSWDEAPRGPV
jgi:hypothetical protein